ncbi:CidA/LrgA family protein [Clostridiaceae bacterium UIB06]|uniref:CidA/LrgA family protein n=1 Tax=Clostridium thailandense TaxID=2794346 RepID=A0A949TWE3_9CLOT|nr:CidA/LrgA family protein [Clostridium thailandense]MBV7274811.1 CidA/LrgA family protein [Clostridium thailandense]MCH5137272.1 CidA/LrgA family protein [Clostridiaceae bacterium UIB06]
MKVIRELSVVFIFCFLGEMIKNILGLTIPGNVIGMILLLISLCLGIVKVEFIEDISKFLLDHLSFFFVPAGVGLVTSIGIVKNCWQYIVITIVLSTIVVMAVTSMTVQLFKRS